ncbi:trace amine-associated receptor 5-like [Crassostrea angulata]|uniref:trace amine-associated receptor 5-like n=1 Tax=Magallana angulata TaxID=2784310 RepID=UPI0022B09A23|nr:trace amine-associated receptor 5-like [Crassostrea angulata]
MANMYVSVTTNITDFYDDVQNSDIFNRSDNSTIKITTVHFNNDELQSKPTFEIMFGDTTFETAFVYVCLVITFLGITGNIAAMAIILYKPKFHTPTFAAIGYLALADFFAGIILGLVRFTTCLYLEIFTCKTFTISLFYYNSSGHLLLLVTVRYLITVHPLISKRHLTVKVVSLCSLSVWFLSALLGGITHYVMANKDSLTTIIRVIINLVVLCAVCSTMISLHIRKIKALQNSSCVRRQTQQRKMNLVITGITVAFMLFQIFLIAEKLYKSFGEPVDDVSVFLSSSVNFTASVYYSCNPYIFFFLSMFLSSKIKNRSCTNTNKVVTLVNMS